jgi:hypothetical protein
MTEIINYIPLPTDGEVQYKGAKENPELWKVTAMNNPNTKFKVVDDGNPPINVAHMFNSETSAQQFIDHHKWIRNHPCPPGQTHDMNTGVCIADTGRDRFGVKKIYPTANGVELYMPEIETPTSHREQTVGQYFQDLNRIRHISGHETSSNDMHFDKGILNVEATGYFKFVNNMDDFDVKLRGGDHSGSGNDKSARCYICRFNKKYFGKEYPHDGGKGYSWSPDDEEHRPNQFKEFDIDFSGFQGKWVGMKGIVFNKGSNKVQIEMWLDLDGIDNNGVFDPERQNWKRLYSIIDDGNGRWGKDTDEHKTADAWTTLQQDSTVQFRVDAIKGKTMKYYSDDTDEHKATFKLLSAREIIVNA